MMIVEAIAAVAAIGAIVLLATALVRPERF